MENLLKRKGDLGRLLDIGCNIGPLAACYGQYAKKTFLCDLNHFIVKSARLANKGMQNASFACANILSLPFADNTFDTVVSLETIEHVNKGMQTQVFDEILRVAKPGAIIYISTPNRFSLAGAEGKLIEAFVKGYTWDAWDTDHKYIYSALRFESFLKGHKTRVKLLKVMGSYFLPGSLVVRLPLPVQKLLGYFSYLIGKFLGHLFPFKYTGFTVTAILEKT